MTTSVPQGSRAGRRRGALLAAAAMVCVGSSVAVSRTIADAPLFTVQAVRYALAAVVLTMVAGAGGRSLRWPRGVEWLWLAGVACAGLVAFNVAVVRGVAHAEPAVLGVAIAAVPLVLAVAGPLVSGGRPAARLLVAAGVVTAGAGVVQGFGRTDAAGLGWAVLVLATEAAFTLLAVPVLGGLGPWAVSLHATWIAAVMLAVLGVVSEGPAAVLTLGAGDLLAAVHLAVVVTALAFVLWYRAVGVLGAAGAGLFTGIAPVAAAAGGVVLGGPAPTVAVWAGTAVVAAGLAIGFSCPATGSGAPQRVTVGARPVPGARPGPLSPGAGRPSGSGPGTSP